MKMSPPAWGRGLKSVLPIPSNFSFAVAPRVGAWIEIVNTVKKIVNENVAPRVGAWIEISTPYSL